MATAIAETGRIDLYKAEIDKRRPFQDPALLKELQNFYRIGLTYASNALEGNSLTISETKIILEDGLTVGGKPLKDTFEAVGHAMAYDYMFSITRKNFLTVDDIYKMHRLFYANIDPENAGVLRAQQVFITGSEYNSKIPQWRDLPDAMEKLGDWMRKKRNEAHPVLFAAELHSRLAQIHPFIDGNGRICRLIMNAALLQDGYPPAVIPPILRKEYIEALEKSWTDGRAFAEFIAIQVLETEKDLMRMLHIPFPDKGGNRVDENSSC